ncbi:DUF4185 domain-containing protein, partial [Rhodococcus hoagii]|nr:DUF4185 domain-containing protein [Prescottella equi]
MSGTDPGSPGRAVPARSPSSSATPSGSTGPPGANGQDWRSNVLGHSTDTDLADGLTIDSMVQDRRCHAAEIIASRHIPNWETTTIPTSGFAIGDRQYLSYMSVRRWSVVPACGTRTTVASPTPTTADAPGPRISMPSGT